MRRFAALIALLSIASAEAVATPEFGIVIDAGAESSIPFTWYEDGPILNHFGAGVGLGMSLEAGKLLVARLETSLFKNWSSAIFNGEYYTGWEGARFALLAGKALALPGGRAEILAGGAVSASNYSGTPLIFAYPSALVELSWTPPLPAWLSNLDLRIPCEWMFRGAYSSASVGLRVGWNMALLPGAKR